MDKKSKTFTFQHTDKKEQFFSIGGIPDKLPELSDLEILKHRSVLFRQIENAEIEPGDWCSVDIEDSSDIIISVANYVDDESVYFPEIEFLAKKVNCTKLERID